MIWIDYALAKRRARDLLRENGIRRPPVDPAEVAESVGLKVVFANFAPQDEGISGFYDPKLARITVNEDEFALRQNFTIAHELGHHVLHNDWAKSSKYRVMYRDPDANNDTKYEKEANTFAASLLVPRFMLDKYWEDNSVEDLSRIFAVSVPVIRNRISSEYGVVRR